MFSETFRKTPPSQISPHCVRRCDIRCDVDFSSPCAPLEEKSNQNAMQKINVKTETFGKVTVSPTLSLSLSMSMTAQHRPLFTPQKLCHHRSTFGQPSIEILYSAYHFPFVHFLFFMFSIFRAFKYLNSI